MHTTKTGHSLQKILLVPVLLLWVASWNTPQAAVASNASYSLADLGNALVQNNGELLKLREEVWRATLDVKDSQAEFWAKIEFNPYATWNEKQPVGQ